MTFPRGFTTGASPPFAEASAATREAKLARGADSGSLLAADAERVRLLMLDVVELVEELVEELIEGLVEGLEVGLGRVEELEVGV